MKIFFHASVCRVLRQLLPRPPRRVRPAQKACTSPVDGSDRMVEYSKILPGERLLDVVAVRLGVSTSFIHCERRCH